MFRRLVKMLWVMTPFGIHKTTQSAINVSKSAASHSPEPLEAGGDFYFAASRLVCEHIHIPAVKRQRVVQARDAQDRT